MIMLRAPELTPTSSAAGFRRLGVYLCLIRPRVSTALSSRSQPTRLCSLYCHRSTVTYLWLDDYYFHLQLLFCARVSSYSAKFLPIVEDYLYWSVVLSCIYHLCILNITLCVSPFSKAKPRLWRSKHILGQKGKKDFFILVFLYESRCETPWMLFCNNAWNFGSDESRFDFFYISSRETHN